MSDKTGIEWTDATWNPVTGCAKVSQGCKHCYAEREWQRMTKLVPAYAGREFTDVRTHADRLDQPLRWKRPRKVFVNSMSDLFHQDVPFEFIDRVFAVMALSKQHVFQVLTKRPDRMREYMHRLGRSAKILDDAARTLGYTFEFAGKYMVTWPLPNIWLGVSVEDQAAADERIPLLLDTPAAVRWISAEPLIGSVDLTDIPNQLGVAEGQRSINALGGYAWECDGPDYVDTCNIGAQIDWVVVGGESGPKARPMHPDWARSLRDQCQAAGVPFIFKQWGEWAPGENCGGSMRKTEATADWFAEKWSFGTMTPRESEELHIDDEPLLYRCGKKRAGRLLDGVQHDGYPKGGA